MTRVALAAALLLLPVRIQAADVTEIHYVMGTFFRITTEEGGRPAMRGCFREARRLESVFSRFDAASELARVNASHGPIRVSPDFARLLRAAVALTDATGGTFDVSVGALTDLWRGSVPNTAPDAAAVAAAKGSAGAGHVGVDADVVRLSPGTRLDFDGIAKGYAVDRCAALLRAAGVRRALVSLGESSLYALGAPPGRTAWTLAVRGADPDTLVGTLHLRDEAASVSATFGDRGKHATSVGHVVDPRTGRPLTDEAVALVVARSATEAEAFSKALLIWGPAATARVEKRSARRAVYVGPRGIARGAAGARSFEPLDAGVRG